MSRLTRDIAVTRVTLSTIGFADVDQLIFAFTGEQAPGASELSAWFAVETGGQPFFLSETLTALDEHGALVWHETAAARRLDPLATLNNLKSLRAQSLVTAIRDVVLARLEWLSQPAATLLAAAAVIGRNCSFGRLCQVAGLGEQEGLNALDELLSARMVVEIHRETRPYTIAHDRIREVVYAQLSTARQQIFHRRAFVALAGVNAPPAELAHHALVAREWHAAFQYSVQAGDAAMRLFAVKTAAHQYECARTLLHENKTDAEDAAVQHLYTNLGRAYELNFQHHEALAVYEEMQTQASMRHSPPMELAALVARCALLPRPHATQNIALAKDLARQALALAHSFGDLKAQVEIELALAWTHKFGDGQLEPTIRHLQIAEAWARQADLREQLGFVTLELGVALISGGQLTQAELCLWESVAIYRELNHQPKLLSGLHNLAIIHMESGQFDSALALLGEAYQANEALGTPTGVYSLATTEVVIYILRGEYNRALEKLLPALALNKTQIWSALWFEISQRLAWCCYDLGDYAEGIAYCRNRRLPQNTGGDAMELTPVLAMLALLHVQCEELNEAEMAVQKGWKSFNLQWQTFNGWWESLSILEAEAELALAQGALDRATRCVDQLLSKYNELGLRHLQPGLLYLAARILLAAGEREEAYFRLSDALALSDTMGAHRNVWAMCWRLGELEAERGNISTAEELRRRATSEIAFIADHAGSPQWSERFLSRPDVQRVRR